MDFSSISNMNNYLKTMNMNHIWKQNANNPKSVIPGSPFKTSQEDTQTSSPFGDERLNGIKTKMKSGEKLSSEDLDYLREKYPDIYDEYVKLEREKKEYEKDLSRCKTKNDARMLHMGKVTEALSAAKSGGDADMILAKLVKMTEAFTKFTESKHFAQLAENYIELAKAIEAEKETITGKKESAEVEQETDENNMHVESDINEQQDQSVQVSHSDPADIENPAPQVANGDNPKPVHKVKVDIPIYSKPAPVTKGKADNIPIETNPTPATNSAAVRAINESVVAEATTTFSNTKFNRQV